MVERRLWGAMVVLSPRHEPLPEDTEARLTDFTELVATAIANAESRVAVARLADEQAALRRVATLVAQGASPQRSLRDRRRGGRPPATGRKRHDGPLRTGRRRDHCGLVEHRRGRLSYRQAVADRGHERRLDGAPDGPAARIDDFSAATDPIGVAAREAGEKSAVGSPIVVEGHLWGVMTATSTEGPLPPDTEARLASFTELVATALANAESREARAVLAEEQAALRRVATLVAGGSGPISCSLRSPTRCRTFSAPSARGSSGSRTTGRW